MNTRGKRVIFALLFIVLVITETFIALYVHDSFVRPYIGDVLIIAVIYCFVRIIIPEKLKLLPIYIFVFATFVEILQYLKISSLPVIRNNAFLRTVIGSTFDISDIVCYLAGALLLIILEYMFTKKTT